ncbi:MAG: hypothetical protein ACFFDN_19950 [Candidatus Hodarchaeota archaeon]
MTIYKFSVISSDGFPYYNLIIKEPSKSLKLYLRFFDFSSEDDQNFNLEHTNSFDLHAGLVSALFKFARSMDKNIQFLEFSSSKEINKLNKKPSYKGNVLITTQTEPYLLHNSIYEKIKIIYKSIIAYKIPLNSSMKILPNEEEKIHDILTDSEAIRRVKKKMDEIKRAGKEFLEDMKIYGLNEICITSFDLSPIIVLGKKYTLDDVHEILRNIGNIPEIAPMHWIYRQSHLSNEQIWVHLFKSNVGPSINGLFEPYFYLLFCDINSYLGETPAILGNIFNKILG